MKVFITFIVFLIGIAICSYLFALLLSDSAVLYGVFGVFVLIVIVVQLRK